MRFWKVNQYECPALASIAGVILSVSSARSGVERPFNISKDTCYYW
jgi:hypothetical protein